jgi:DnaK suppressor protein
MKKRFARRSYREQLVLKHREVSGHSNTLDSVHLRLVQEALDRLDSGGYGSCMKCEDPISVKRLRAIPWARYCLRCQESMGLVLTDQ